MIIRSSAVMKTARADVWVTILAGGKVDFYSGTMPAAGGTPPGGLLASVTFPTPPGTVTAGAFSVTPNLETVATLSGDPTWCRVYKANGDWLLDLDCGETNSTAAVWVSPLSIFSGGTLRLIKLKLIEP